MRRGSNPLIIIPSRMAATRLPNKPMADICGKPMIARMVERALAADAGRVVVATDHQDIADVVTAEGGEFVMTDPDLPSGTDRVFAAASIIDPEGKHDIVVNLQGDMPCFDSAIIPASIDVLARFKRYDISTLVAPMLTEEEKQTDAVVKAIVSWHNNKSPLPSREGVRGRGQENGSPPPQPSPSLGGGSEEAIALEPTVGRALYFSRQCIPTAGPWWHHLGIYAFRRAALARFVALPPSPLEQSERLEQLRAMESGMSIGIGKVPSAPLGVDTPETLEMARVQFRRLSAS